jgi:hypothetical protein
MTGFLVQGGSPPNLSVTTAKIVDDAVTTAKIADVNVTTAKIANLNVTTGKIAANAVDETKLKDALVADFTEVTVAAGDSILLGDVTDSGNTKRDTVQGILDLTSSGLALIATGTASNSASLAFTSVITSTYDSYMILFEALRPATSGTTLQVYLSDDNGSSYTTSDMRYINPVVYYAGSGSPSGNGGNVEAVAVDFWQPTSGGILNATNQGLSGVMYLHDAPNNASLTRFHAMSVYSSSATHNELSVGPGFGNTVSATTKDALKIQFASGNITDGKVKIYGIKAS